jgi:hypothetical protein
VGLLRNAARGNAALGWSSALVLACGFDPSGVGGSGQIGDTTTVPSDSTWADVDDSVSASDPAGDDAASNTAGTDSAGPEDGVDSLDSTGGPVCDDWWKSAWTRRREVVVQEQPIEQAIPDVPALVLLNPDRIEYGATQIGGNDLRFVTDTNVVLPHEVETWSQDQVSYVWLRLPEVAAQGSPQPKIWMYYGNPGAANEAMPQQVWDAGFVSVHHLRGHDDSTVNGHDGASGTPPVAVPGWIGGAQRFDGVDDQLTLMGESAYDFTDALTVEAWIRVESFDLYYQAIVTKGDDAWRLHREATSSVIGFGTDTDTTADDNFPGVTPVNDGEWHYVVAVLGSDEKRLFVDGVSDGTMPYVSSLRLTDHDVMIGENQQNVGRFFDGDIDEVRISSVSRGRGWIGVQHTSMNDELLEYGPEETCP